MKIKEVVYQIKNTSGEQKGYMIFCPACKCAHVFDERWNFNGDFFSPTFKPSMLVNASQDQKDASQGELGHRCHFYIINGHIQFLSDSTHGMINRTVKLEPVA